MDLLISDRGEAEVKDILRMMYAIDDFQSEPHQKNQNFFEHWWQVMFRKGIFVTAALHCYSTVYFADC